MIPNCKQIEELSVTTNYGIKAYAYKIGKMCFVNIEGDGSQFKKWWTNYDIVTINNVKAKRKATSIFNNQNDQTGALTINDNSNIISLNYFATSNIVNSNSWIRGQLIFICE